MLRDRGVDVVDIEGWADIDAAEQALGMSTGRARTKIATWAGLLGARAGQLPPPARGAPAG